MINWSNDIPNTIKTVLQYSGWIIKTSPWSGWPVTIFEKWTEKITFRGFDSSSANWLYPGWRHEQTIEVFKNVINWQTPIKTEIKFILPN